MLTARLPQRPLHGSRASTMRLLVGCGMETVVVLTYTTMGNVEQDRDEEPQTCE